MPRARATKTFSTFIKGLITEASPLNFPENFALALDNVELFRDGSIKRRFGLSQNTDAITTAGSNNVSSFLWENVGNDIAFNIAVVQVDKTFYFYDASLAGNLWDNLISSIAVGTSQGAAQYTTIDGKLMIFPWALQVSATPSVITSHATTPTDILVRDLWGVDDIDNFGATPTNKDLTAGDGISFRVDLTVGGPSYSTISSEHLYNLFNQGWYGLASVSSGALVPNAVGPIYYWSGGFDGMAADNTPANADVWWRYKKPGSGGEILNIGNGEDHEFTLNSGRAPQGHYILPFFRRGATRQTEAQVAYDQIIGKGFTPAAKTITLSEDRHDTIPAIRAGVGWTGRLFYAGLSSAGVTDLEDTAPEISKFILFSQVVKKDGDEFKCYQENDPTSENLNSPLATDGGFIKINEVDKILKLIPLQDSLVVIATNGVWAIKGSDEGFSALNFQVTKISDVGSLGFSNVVSTEDAIFFASRGGIYVLQPNEVGQLSVQNITESTIQTGYAGIPNTTKENAVGFYEIEGRKVRWLYNDLTDYDPDVGSNIFNRELIFDIVLGAWSLNSFDPSATRHVASYIRLPTDRALSTITNVVAGSDNVVAGPSNVVIPSTLRLPTTNDFLYVVRDGVDMGFASTDDSSFEDWGDTDFISFLETGYIHEGDSARDKKINRLITHMTRTETGFIDDGNGNLSPENPSGCFLQARWEYSEGLTTDPTQSASNRWSKNYNPLTNLWETKGFQIYRLNRNYIPSGSTDPFDYGESIITTKHRIRGRGTAVRLRFESESGKDFQIPGWGFEMSLSGRI